MLLTSRRASPSNEATKSLQDFEFAAQTAARQLFEDIKERAAAMASEFGVNPDSTLKVLLTRLNDYDNGLFTDGRAGIWRARIRLYRSDQLKEVIADSDADRDPREDGKTLHISIPAMLKWVIEFIETHSAGIPMGLDNATLARRTRSFRTQLSNRRDGTGFMNIDYNVQGVDMLARVDVKREMGTAAYEVKTAAERLESGIAHRRGG